MKFTFAAAVVAGLTLSAWSVTAAEAAPIAPQGVASVAAQGDLITDVRMVCRNDGSHCRWRPGPGPGRHWRGAGRYHRCVTRVTRGPWGVKRTRVCR